MFNRHEDMLNRNSMANNVDPQPILGEVDAEADWEEDPALSSRLFLQTETYETFEARNALFLFGRRGSGKTAMLKKLSYDIDQKKSSLYSFVGNVASRVAFNKLAITIRSSPLKDFPPAELTQLLSEKWRWVINVVAMQSVIRGDVTHICEYDSKEDDLTEVSSYIRSTKLISEEDDEAILMEVAAALAEELERVEHVATKVGAALIRAAQRLFSPKYTLAKAALTRLLEKSKAPCVVLIDSLEIYGLRDEIRQACTVGLIESVLMFYRTRSHHRIYIKAALPSEIFYQIPIENQGKIGGHTVFVRWRYSDLVSLVARRYLRITEPSTTSETATPEELRERLLQYIPEFVNTRSGVLFDTLAYIVQHTQKKPRQLLYVFNSILTLAGINSKSSNAARLLTEQEIVQGVHSRLDYVLEEAIDVFRDRYPAARSLVRGCLTGLPSYFSQSDLDRKMKEISVLRNVEQLSTEDVKRLLLETGLIGKVEGRSQFGNGPKTLLHVLFEYQIKSTLRFTNDAEYAIHPIANQELHVQIDTDTIVYPIAAEDDEIEALRNSGIELA